MLAKQGQNREEIKDIGQNVRRMGEVGLLAHDLVKNVHEKGLILIKP